MTDNTQPEALRLADEVDEVARTYPDMAEVSAELRRQHARIAELEAQPESIGADGVSGPLMGKPQEMPDLSALTERGAKAWVGIDAQELRGGGADISKEREDFNAWLRTYEEEVGAIDEAAAWAGFSGARASLAASAGSELVAQPGDAEAILSEICDLFFIGKLARNESTILTNIRNVIHHAGLLHAVERDLFPQPELPEDDDPYAEVDEGLPAPNSWAAKDEADYVAQFRAALAARGFNAQGLREGVAPGAEGAGSEPVANNRPSLESVFRGLSDRAYCNYIEQMRRNECLGWEHKVKHGTFGEAELKAHTLAGRLLGRHHAFAEAANALRGSNAPLTHPSPPEGMVGGWRPIETAPKDGVFLVYMQDEVRPARRMAVANWHPNVKIVGGLFSFDCATVTHWMPLPPPPTTSAGSGKGE